MNKRKTIRELSPVAAAFVESVMAGWEHLGRARTLRGQLAMATRPGPTAIARFLCNISRARWREMTPGQRYRLVAPVRKYVREHYPDYSPVLDLRGASPAVEAGMQKTFDAVLVRVRSIKAA
jgi:hypothetical protein